MLIKPADFQISPAQVAIFIHKIERFKYEHMQYMQNLAIKKAFAKKSRLKEASGLITIIGMLKIWEALFFQQKLKFVENYTPWSRKKPSLSPPVDTIRFT